MMLEPIAWKSKMARRLLRIFVLLVAVPLVVIALIFGFMGYTQILAVTGTMNRIHERAIAEAGKSFRRQGGDAVRQSTEQTKRISLQAIHSMVDTLSKEQGNSLQATARDFSELTHENVRSATQQSLSVNRASLGHVGKHMSTVFEKSARATQRHASGNIEKAMLALNDTLMQERASRLALMVSENISDATNFLTLIAQMPGMSEGDADVQKATLDSLVRRYPKFMLLTVLDKHGKETAMSASDRVVAASEMSSRPEADYFKAAIRGEVWLSTVQRSGPVGAPALQMAVPIEMYRGKPVGVLAAKVSLEELWDTVRTTRVGKTGFAYIVDETGRTITAPRSTTGSSLSSSAPIEPLHDTVRTLPWRVVVSVPRDEAMEPVRVLNHDISDSMHRTLGEMRTQIQVSSQQASAHLQREASHIQSASDAQMKVHTTRVVRRLTDTTTRTAKSELSRMQDAIRVKSVQTQTDNDNRMVRTAAASSHELAERVQALSVGAMQSAQSRIAVTAMVILMISCAIGSLIALITAGRIVRPVVRLSQAAHAIACGDLDRRVEERAPDEIGDLASAFNTMADSLQKSRADLNDAEGQLVQSAKLASLGTLSAGVAHELNQPVAIIRGITQQLQEEPGLAEDLCADLKIIEGQTGRMTKIIKHLRTFCRTGGAEFSEVDVHRTVQDCLLLIGEQLRTHDIEVSFELCDGEPIVLGDANELEQVFLNLITNARDAMDGRPGSRITIGSHVLDNRLVLEFRDNGTGIPAEVCERIFDPFFTTKEAGKGTGLGLSISHTIIGKHQGELRVHNDNGAVFTITLPLAQSAGGQALKAA